MSRIRRVFRVAPAALVVALPAAAQPAPSAIAVTTTLERVVESVQPDGSVSTGLEAVSAVAPDDRLFYTVRFTNRSDRQLSGVRITSPIPAAVHYVEGTASGPGVSVLFSVDGGRMFGAPSELRVADDVSATRPAEPADYTHVRWILDTPLDAGATAFARFGAVAR